MTVFDIMVKPFSMEKKTWYQCSPSHPECDISDWIRVCSVFPGRGGKQFCKTPIHVILWFLGFGSYRPDHLAMTKRN